MTLAELDAFLRSLHPVPEPSSDRITFGGPRHEVRKVGVCWQAYVSVIRQARDLGLDTLVVHEPLFYTHDDLAESGTSWDWGAPEAEAAYRAQIAAKKALLTESGIGVVRCHDVADAAPGWGVPFAWGRELGFGEPVASKTYYNVYEVEEAPALEVARGIARKVAALGQRALQFWGDPARLVRRVGVGTGCYSSPVAYMDLGADLYVAVDDTVRNWVETTFALDTGLPLVVVNHGTAEEAGVRALASLLGERLPGLEIRHIPQGCSYDLVMV